ncbi:hypothetical protein [Streptomyces sp. NRRL S-87]|uniref:hypothetical protein n=1 Tax=Streptomyces sp. NRRL S-87 TaxID=1463920 RepID=UPI0004C155DB|nr:hypothetical protein [Streptomyces sp. NRRL S-87]
MFEYLRQWLSAGVLVSAGWLAGAVLLFLIAQGHVVVIGMLARTYLYLYVLPEGAVFRSWNGCLAARAYDPETDEDKTYELIRVGRLSFLRWRSGRARSAASVRRRFALEAAWRAGILLFVTVPVFGVVAWLTYAVDPLWAYVLVFLVAHQVLTGFVPGGGFYLRPWLVHLFVVYVFLDGADLWHPSLAVAAPVYCGFVLLGMARTGRDVRARLRGAAERQAG